MEERTRADVELSEVLAIVAELRGERGCPWDREQTHVSLKSALLEETYELLEAIEKGDSKELEEELGDLLLQVVFHCQLAAEQSRFTLGEVVSRLKEKLIRRHPHVFEDRSLLDTHAVLRQRASIKAQEKRSGQSRSSLGNVPRAMPSLARAQRITDRASYVGFDWPGPEQVWDKVEEELHELKVASSSGDKRRTREEMGDLFFSLVNLARFYGFEAEDALAEAVDRFLKRFLHIETRLREQGKTPAESSLEEMDSLWEEAKSLEPLDNQLK